MDDIDYFLFIICKAIIDAFDHPFVSSGDDKIFVVGFAIAFPVKEKFEIAAPAIAINATAIIIFTLPDKNRNLNASV